jgi:C1A family cysteine protease
MARTVRKDGRKTGGHRGTGRPGERNVVPVGAAHAADVVPAGDGNAGGARFAHQVQISQEGPAFPVLTRNPTISQRHIQWYGWRPDLPDPRDHLFAAPLALSLPPRFDLRTRHELPPVYNQGQLGSCSGNAIAAAVQFERIRQRLTSGKLVPSRLFIYYNERSMEGTVSSDSGAHIRDGIKSVASQGDCFESGPNSWPYVVSKFKQQPARPCYELALRDRVVSYSRLVQSLDQMKGCLASGYPFVFGFSVFESFEGKQVEKTGIVSMPAAGERPVGGHAVLAVGYDDKAQRFAVRNSWGSSWGQKGYFTIPYAYLTHPGLASDFWTIRLLSVAD